MSLTSSRRLRRTDKRRVLGTPRRRHLRVERLEERVVLSAGFVTTSIGESAVAYNHFVEQDGDIIVAGYSSPAGNDPTTFAIARYQENGALDPSFGNAGSVMTSIARANDYGMAVAAYPDNKVVLAGNGYDAYSSFDADFAVARYDQYGNLDKTFGGKAKNAGKVQIDVGQDRTYDVMVQPDEKIVGAGCIRQDGEDYSEFTLVRYTTAGKLDADFGNGGIVTTDIGDKGSFVQAVTVHQDGILAAGHTVNIATGSNFAIARYLLDGNLDTSFGEDSSGIIVMDFNSEPGWGTGDEIEAVSFG